MQRQGKVYSLTYDDSNLPAHYGWKTDAHIKELEQRVKLVKGGKQLAQWSDADLEMRVQRILAQLDSSKRWMTVSKGERLVGQPKIHEGMSYLSSEVFSNNLSLLSQYIENHRD